MTLTGLGAGTGAPSAYCMQICCFIGAKTTTRNFLSCALLGGRCSHQQGVRERSISGIEQLRGGA